MTQSLSQSFKTLVAASWKATEGERLRFFTFMVLFVLAYSVDLLVPWAIGYILGVFVQEGFTAHAYSQSLIGIMAYIGLRLINTAFHHYARYLQNTVAFHARMKTLSKLFDTFLSFPLRWHVSHHSGENLSKLHRSVGAVDSMLGTYIWQVVEGLVKLVIASLALFALDFWVAVNVLAMGVVTILIMVLFNKQLTKSIRENNSFYDRINRTCVDYLFNIVTVKTLKLEDGAQKYLRAQQPQGLSVSRRISKYTELKWGSVGTGYSFVLGSSLFIYFYGHRDFVGPFDIAQVYVLMNYLDKIFQAIGSFTGYYGGIIEASTAYEDAQTILNEASKVEEKSGLCRIMRDWKEISINGLDFSYPGSERAGLTGVSLRIKRGDKIALVGPSGGGKSTLLKLMAGMLYPDKAHVKTESQDYLSLDDVAHLSLLLPQEPEIFSESISYNLTMGEQFSQEEMNFVVSLCRVKSIIEKLPRGWDSDLAEKGLNISVGEKQRVAMARGLLRAADKDFLLLDEPTSSLDPMTEKEIFQGILNHFQDRTVITACHRLALVPLFDIIFYIRGGRVEEVGSFKELTDRKGAFSRAWDDYQQKVVKEYPDQVGLHVSI